MSRSRTEIVAWCAAGAIVGWLVGTYVFLAYFAVNARHAFLWVHPLNSPVMLVFVVCGTVIFGGYAVRGLRERWQRLLFGSIIGGLIGESFVPAYAFHGIFARLLAEPLIWQEVLAIPVVCTATCAGLALRRERASRLRGARYGIAIVAGVFAFVAIGSMVGNIVAGLFAGVFVTAVAGLILD